jgi:hypothetical protein
VTENPYINFVERPDQKRKTMVWWIVSKSSGSVLGKIKWYGAWRQYCFYPENYTIFNTGCMESINEFIKEQMAARRG